MANYRFRVIWEEDENVERTILIKSHQTFFDFFKILTNSLKLENTNVSASFFTSDDYWDKHIEITLREEDVQNQEKLMEKTKIASLVEQPHQKFVFVYDAELQLTFLIELIKIQPDEGKDDEYPKVISSKGNIPKRRKTKKKLPTASNDSTAFNPSNILSDDELDKMIYSKITEINITEEDVLNGKLDDLFKELDKNKIINEEEEDMDEELEDEFFDEDENRIDDDFHQDGYFDEEYEK